MNADQREAIRENAKYLRQVRPIDPEEIDAYVPGQPHPAVVREVLRESAPELGLIERADGTFVPVANEPLAAADLTFGGADAESTDGTETTDSAAIVEAFPEPHSRRLEDRLVDRYGPGWPEGDTGDRLRERIRELKRAYFASENVTYDADTALAYAIYHLPDYYAAASYLLSDLAADGLLPTHLRVADIGAGVGGPALALFDALPDDALCEYHAIEPSPAADLLSELLDDPGRNKYAEIHRERAEDFEPGTVGFGNEGESGGDDGGQSGSNGGREFDLLVFANVLSELDDPVGEIDRYLDYLAPDGTLLLFAPADRETAIGLRAVERALADREGLTTVYAPTVRLWPAETPTDRCWSFDVKPEFGVPGFQRRLDEAASDPDHEPGEFVNTDVQYAYSICRQDGRKRIGVTPDERRVAKLADAEAHVSERVNAVAIKLSHSLSDAGRTGGEQKGNERSNPLYLIGDGSQAIDHYAVLTRETALNRDLREADYGSLLRFENVLVLWNDDEGAYNLVVDDETIVDAIPT